MASPGESDPMPMSSALAGESVPEDVFTEVGGGAFLVGFKPPQTKANLRPDDPVPPVSKGISATVADLASDRVTNTNTNNQESIGTSEEKVEEHSGPASENLAALSHHTESSAEKSLPIPQYDEPISQVHPDSEKDEEPPSVPISQDDAPVSEGSHPSESSAEPLTLAPSTDAEPLSVEPPEVEVAEAPSLTSLSVDGDESDSALGDPSIK